MQVECRRAAWNLKGLPCYELVSAKYCCHVMEDAIKHGVIDFGSVKYCMFNTLAQMSIMFRDRDDNSFVERKIDFCPFCGTRVEVTISRPGEDK